MIMKHIKKFKLNESELPLIIISLEKYGRLVNDEKVYFSRKPLKHGNNIFTSQLAKLAQGKEIEVPDYNYRAKLENDFDIKQMLKMLVNSPLNKVYSLFFAFLLTHPKIDDFYDGVENVFK